MPPGYTHTAFGFGSFLDWRPTSFTSAIPASRVCSACGLVPSTAALLPCLHRLCPSCFERCADGECGGQCPVDKQGFESEDVAWSSFEKDALLNRKIHCWNADHGCDAAGSASDILEHFNYHCQYHVVSCPSCGQDVAHKDVISHLNSESCLVAAEESRNVQDRLSNVSAVPAESIQIFEKTLKDNLEMSLTILTKISEARVAEESNADAIKTQLRELQGIQARICEERTQLSAALVSIKAKVDIIADEQAAGNGNVGNRLQKVEALIGECKTVGTTSGQALVDMKIDFTEKLNNLEDSSKAIFLDLRGESEPFEWAIQGWSKLKEKCIAEEGAYSEAEKASYFRGYYILPGVWITIGSGDNTLWGTLRVCMGAYDHLLTWPIRESFCLRIDRCNGEYFEDSLELDTRDFADYACNRPTTPQNWRGYSVCRIKISEIEAAGCINNDKLRVRFEMNS